MVPWVKSYIDAEKQKVRQSVLFEFNDGDCVIYRFYLIRLKGKSVNISCIKCPISVMAFKVVCV